MERPQATAWLAWVVQNVSVEKFVPTLTPGERQDFPQL